MRRGWRLALTLGSLAACGDDLELPTPSGEAVSGTRLKIARYVYADGVRQDETAWFHDAAREERCAPARWSDGQTYCTPSAAEAVYIDGACTELRGRVEEGAPAPTYLLRRFGLGGERWPSRLYRAGELAAPVTQQWEQRDGACLGPSPVGTARFYALGDEIAREELVRIKHAGSTEVARIGVELVTSDDGLRAPGRLHDRALDVACMLDVEPSMRARTCLPDGLGDARYYADAGCTEAAVAVASGDAIPRVMRARDERTRCDRAFAVGPELPTPPLFTLSLGVCQEINPRANEHLYGAGEPITLATLARTTSGGSGRLRVLALSDGALALPDPRLHDTALGTDCRRADLDGITRCLPDTSTWLLPLSSDAACSTPITVAMVDTRACAPTSAFARGLVDGRAAVVPVLAPTTAPLYHLSTSEACVPYLAPEPWLAPHAIGPAVPPDALPTPTLVVDR